jgi:molybdopterin-binding protein
MPVLSARNQLTGTVKSIVTDRIMAEIVVTLDGGQEIVSVITASSLERLALKVDQPVTVVVKSTEVMLSVGD